MKTIGTIFLVLLISFLPLVSFSQIFGVKAGLNLSKMILKDDDIDFTDEFEMKPGLLIGPTVEFPLMQDLSIESGLLLSSKGFKDSYEESYQGGFYESKTTLNLWYIDIPILFKWNFKISEKTSLYPAIGPYIGIGLKGYSKNETKSNSGEETHKEDIEWGNDEDTDFFKRFDAGLTIGGGIEYKAFQLGIYYNLGIANIAPSSENGATIQNRVLQFTLGYRFIPKEKTISDQ